MDIKQELAELTLPPNAQHVDSIPCLNLQDVYEQYNLGYAS